MAKNAKPASNAKPATSTAKPASHLPRSRPLSKRQAADKVAWDAYDARLMQSGDGCHRAEEDFSVPGASQGTEPTSPFDHENRPIALEMAVMSFGAPGIAHAHNPGTAMHLPSSDRAIVERAYAFLKFLNTGKRPAPPDAPGHH